MKVKVLLIEPIAPNLHKVVLLIGSDQFQFVFTTTFNQVGDRLLHTTYGDAYFSEVFRFNQRVAWQITQLVIRFKNKETVELPADVGNLVTPEIALSKQKSWPIGHKSSLPETV